MSKEVPTEALERVKGSLQAEVGRYYEYLTQALQRTNSLLTGAIAQHSDATDDIVRAVVVLNHAYLEDFLRTLARTLLPMAGETVLGSVPLAGSGGRAEKFSLGALSKHRGKTVEQVIQDSVSEYLERSNFNSTTEIVSFLKELGVTLTHKTAETLPAIDRMIQRRHLIVHRADRVKKDDSPEYELQAVDLAEVVDWTFATDGFMSEVLKSFLTSERVARHLAEKLNIDVME